jgi:hypothetical protein
MPTDKFLVTFPEVKNSTSSQDQEWCFVELDGIKQKIKFHDYHEIYRVPGLYEHLFCDKLGCVSPEVITSLLKDAVAASPTSLSELDVLEIGAGNGIVGELLKKQGISSIVGIDIVPEAAEAARRDRPSVYNDYHIANLEDLSPDIRQKLETKRFNCLVTVGALGFGDVPPEAFATAFGFIAKNGWIAFNIKEDFLEESDQTGFSGLVRRMVERDILEVAVQHRYRHRLSVGSQPLYYVGVVAKKKGDF